MRFPLKGVAERRERVFIAHLGSEPITSPPPILKRSPPAKMHAQSSTILIKCSLGEFLSDRLQPVYDGLGKLRKFRGVPRCARFEEPGVGSIPGKIGKDLNMHPNSFDLDSDCFEAASVMGFGVFTDVAIGFTWLYGGAFIQ